MKTTLNIKTDKLLKLEAQKTADEFGIPLGTIMNAFLRQFVRNKEISLDISYQPTKYLTDILKEAEIDFKNGQVNGPFNGGEFIKRLQKI